jgi:phosphoesterase RecJ-like protein
MVALGVALTPEIASALYVGLVTDTGRFMYSNTDGRSHRLAADLIDAGVDVHDHFRRLYEHVPLAKLKLIARALEKTELVCEGRVAVSYISQADYEAVGASEELTEGVIDYLRSIEGIRVAATIRDTGAGAKKARKASLRSSDGAVDVSEIARKQGGGGHARAAGFSTDDSYDKVVEYLCSEVSRQL